jgi:hypothetical protein
VRLFEIHDQKWFPQFLRDEFVDGLQMILDVTSTYQPSLPLVAAPLDVSFRSFFDVDFLLEGLLAGRASRDDKRTCDKRLSMGDRREVRRTIASPGYVPSWLSAECIRRIRRLSLPRK